MRLYSNKEQSGVGEGGKRFGGGYGVGGWMRWKNVGVKLRRGRKSIIGGE